MGLSHSPRIVTDGLVLCLDAANKRSYPGAGTTWTDLTANKNNGTLTNMNSSNFSSENGGTISTDGSNEKVVISASSDFGTVDFTFSYWIYSLNQNSGYDAHMTVNEGSNNGFIPNLNWSFGNTTGKPQLRYWINNSVPLTYQTLKNYYLEWRYLSWTYDLSDTTGRIYEDGVLVAESTSINKTMSNNGNHYVWIGNDQFGSSTVGKFSHVTIHNRALTADEVRQNYEATVGRYI